MTEFKHMMSNLQGFDENLFENSFRWKLLEELYQNNYPSSDPFITYVPRIPKIIHQIWVGGKPFPARYKWWVDSWKKHNPTYEYKLWTDENVGELDLPKIYYQILNPGPKSDIIRYHVLNKFGGIYVDTDFECLKPFDIFLPCQFITSVGYQWNNWDRAELYPGFMACIPNHFIMAELVKKIDQLTMEEYRNKSVHSTTSSYFFTDVFFDEIKNYKGALNIPSGVVATPPQIFYPFPNHKNHSKDVGRKHIQPNSYANHHWEVSWCGKDGEPDWVQGFKFVDVADFVYAPKVKASDDYAKYPNTFDPSALREDKVNIVYCCTMYLAKLIRILNDLTQYKFVILNHNGDQHMEDGVIGTFANAKKIAEEPYILTDNILKVYTVNPDTRHPKVDMLPVGIENSMWKSDKRTIITELRKNQKQRNGFVLMNFGLSTNREEREGVYNRFKTKSWVTTYDKTTYQQFYDLLSTFKFVLNPMGNCFDNHRMWEAWYLGCIPISKSSITIDYYKDFPHVVVKDWEEVTEEFLQKEYNRITNMQWEEDKLWFPYWKNKITTLW